MNDLRKTTERGTKAWADVPNATEWVEELRGNDTREVTREVSVNNVEMSEERVHKTDKSIHEWVGLSEDEFEKILETHNEAMPFAVYLSIEAKLKEKNT